LAELIRELFLIMYLRRNGIHSSRIHNHHSRKFYCRLHQYPRGKRIRNGALVGVYVATQISNDQFKDVFKFLMVGMLFIILVKPKRWLSKDETKTPLPQFIAIPLFLAVGFYGGFIQMGMGIFFLAVLVLASHYNIINGNAIKAFTVMFYTLFVIVIFQINGMIDWTAGLLLAVGQMIGGYVTAQFASKYKSADVWAYRMLVLIVILVILKLFGIIQLPS